MDCGQYLSEEDVSSGSVDYNASIPSEASDSGFHCPIPFRQRCRIDADTVGCARDGVQRSEGRGDEGADGLMVVTAEGVHRDHREGRVPFPGLEIRESEGNDAPCPRQDVMRIASHLPVILHIFQSAIHLQSEPIVEKAVEGWVHVGHVGKPYGHRSVPEERLPDILFECERLLHDVV